MAQGAPEPELRRHAESERGELRFDTRLVDLREEEAAFEALAAVAAAAGAPLTRLRILDILIWRTAEAWH